jgi:DNA-binding response OmpR family regulator
MNNVSKILIIEDNVDLVKIYQNKLQKEGYKVSIALDGKKGLELTQDEKPNIILLDILLPKLSGREVLKKLKTDPNTSSIPVLILSNLSEMDEVLKGLEEGAVDYMIKAEHSLQEVVERVKSILSSTEESGESEEEVSEEETEEEQY